MVARLLGNLLSFFVSLGIDLCILINSECPPLLKAPSDLKDTLFRRQKRGETKGIQIHGFANLFPDIIRIGLDRGSADNNFCASVRLERGSDPEASPS